MFRLACLNEITGVISAIASPGDQPIVDRLHLALVNNSASDHVLLFQREHFKFAVFRRATIYSIEAEKIEISVTTEIAKQFVNTMHEFLKAQMAGYADFSHDMLYFAGEALYRSTIHRGQIPNYEDLEERITVINDLANYVAAKSTYYRYINEHIDNLDEKQVDLMARLSRLSRGAAYLEHTYNKEVLISVVGPIDLRLLCVDYVDFIFLSIIENAVKYGRPLGVDIRIRVQLTADGDLQVSFSDYGLWVPDDELERLFDRSFRSSTARKLEIPGDGLGLFQAEAAVRRLFGGTIAFHQGLPFVDIKGIRYVYTTVTIVVPRERVLSRLAPEG